MDKIKLGNNIFDYPMPVTLLGTTVNGRANFMALGWMTRANASPPMVAVGVGRHHHTHPGIMECGEFSINYPRQDMVAAADYCGIYSGRDTDKSGLFDIFYGDLKSAPMIKECTLNLSCRLIQQVDLPTNTLFIGEITECFCEEQYMTDGRPDVTKMKPYTLTMPENAYWSMGGRIGSAWQDGKNFRR